MRGLDPRIHLQRDLLISDGLPGHRRAEATPSFGRLCPAMKDCERYGPPTFEDIFRLSAPTGCASRTSSPAACAVDKNTIFLPPRLASYKASSAHFATIS